MTARANYNASLCAAWFKANRMPNGTPPVAQQCMLQHIKLADLNLFGYNPSIVDHDGGYLMSYRFHPKPDSPVTQLAIAVLDKSLAVKSNWPVVLPSSLSNEDARLFFANGKMRMSWNEATMMAGARGVTVAGCVVKHGELEPGGKEWLLNNVQAPEPPTKQQIQKNWVFFEWPGGGIGCIYQTDPKMIVLRDNGEKSEFDCPQWKYGALRGGTGFLKFGDKLLRFVHSRLDDDPKPAWWRYFMGAMVHDRTTLKPLAISQKPILVGSENDLLTQTQKASWAYWKPKVVIPYGAVATDGGWLVSIGVNDSSCALAKITPDMLNLQ
jgi:predicted GH43/DUF377 family glycosyl hydrolase